MDKETLKKLAENPEHIPGIYNYCDRWCERCTMTSKCLTFATESHEENLRSAHMDPDMIDMENVEFWKGIEDSLRLTFELIQDFAEREGIDLNDLDNTEYEQHEAILEQHAKNHDCTIQAKQYAKIVNEWFNSSEDIFNDKADELNRKIEMNIPESHPLEEADQLKDMTNIIRWYQHQIYVKLMRAVTGRVDDEANPDNEFPLDSDGSAKVALIGIDRSISAWANLQKFLPEASDIILDYLVLLERLRRKTEKSFPNARAFIRPGFDDR